MASAIGKKGLTPLVATIILMLFAIAVGLVVMTLNPGLLEAEQVTKEKVVCFGADQDKPIDAINAKYFDNKISDKQYQEQLRALLCS